MLTNRGLFRAVASIHAGARLPSRWRFGGCVGNMAADEGNEASAALARHDSPRRARACGGAFVRALRRRFGRRLATWWRLLCPAERSVHEGLRLLFPLVPADRPIDARMPVLTGALALHFGRGVLRGNALPGRRVCKGLPERRSSMRHRRLLLLGRLRARRVRSAALQSSR
jgi:hypothetical protein